MHLLIFVASRLAVLTLIACAGFGAGSLFLSRRRFFSPLERVVVAITLGLGVIATLIFLLGILGCLYQWAVVSLFAGMAARGLGYAEPLLAAALEYRYRPQACLRVMAVTLLAVAILAPVLSAALYPPTAFDALMYHLPVARSYLQSHQIRPLTNLRFPVFPELNEMLFAGAMLLCDDVTAQLVELLFLVLVLATLMSWAQRLRRPVTGLWSVALLAGTPMMMFLSSTAHVDMGLTAFATLGFYALHCYRETGDRAWLTLAGAFGGCAAGTKYSGLFVLALFTATALGMTWRNRVSIGRVWPFAAAALALSGPWYLWNAFWTGDPVWPFLGRFFGYRFWTRGDVETLVWSLQGYGWGRTFRSFLLLPWNLAFHRPVGGEPRIQPGLFALLPLTVWWTFRKKEGRGLLAAIAAYVVLWFYTTQQLRFLLPVLPVLALLDSRALDGLSAGLRRSMPLWAERATAGLIFVTLSSPLLGLYLTVYRNGPLPTSAPARDAFLQQRLPTYAIYRDLNTRYGHGYTIYAFYDEAGKYYCDGTQIGDWFGVGRYGDIPLDSASKLFQSLRSLNADFLLVTSEPSAATLASKAASQEFFEPICTDGEIKLFRLVKGQVPEGASQPPRLASVVPATTRAGIAFQIQPNGAAAISVVGEGFRQGAVLFLNNQLLSTTYGCAEGMTAVVPSDLYAEPGHFSVFVVNPDGRASNAVWFDVLAR